MIVYSKNISAQCVEKGGPIRRACCGTSEEPKSSYCSY